MSINLPTGDARARYDSYAGIVRAHQGKIVPGVDTVLGLRGLGTDGAHHDSSENIGPYNDMFVVLRQGTDGTTSLLELSGSTHAGQKSSSLSKDGVAQIRPGSFDCVPNGEHDGMPSWHILSDPDPNLGDPIPAWRDRNKDGYISVAEKSYAQEHNTKATEILFHNGRLQDHGTSIGCQVMRPDVMQSFIDKIGVQSSFYYTLVDANED